MNSWMCILLRRAGGASGSGTILQLSFIFLFLKECRPLREFQLKASECDGEEKRCSSGPVDGG